jgi:hypothetical protein
VDSKVGPHVLEKRRRKGSFRVNSLQGLSAEGYIILWLWYIKKPWSCFCLLYLPVLLVMTENLKQM